MGGMGSGSRMRCDRKTRAEEVRSIDIRYLRKYNLLKPCVTGRLSWSSGEVAQGSIGYSISDKEMVLNYHYRKDKGVWQPVEETISFDYTSCNYGGGRRWFLCPKCNQRVAVPPRE